MLSLLLPSSSPEWAAFQQQVKRSNPYVYINLVPSKVLRTLGKVFYKSIIRQINAKLSPDRLGKMERREGEALS